MKILPLTLSNSTYGEPCVILCAINDVDTLYKGVVKN